MLYAIELTDALLSTALDIKRMLTQDGHYAAVTANEDGAYMLLTGSYEQARSLDRAVREGCLEAWSATEEAYCVECGDSTPELVWSADLGKACCAECANYAYAKANDCLVED